MKDLKNKTAAEMKTAFTKAYRVQAVVHKNRCAFVFSGYNYILFEQHKDNYNCEDVHFEAPDCQFGWEEGQTKPSHIVCNLFM